MPETSKTRRHHYIPRFFLALFTEDGTEGGLLDVVGLPGGATWRCRPSELAHERDYYRVDADGVSANAFEDGFAVFEGRAAGVIRSIAESAAIPRDSEFSTFINFVSLLIARVPGTREVFDRQFRSDWQERLQSIVSTPEAFEAEIARSCTTPEELADAPDYDEMCDWVVENIPGLEIPRARHILHLLAVHDRLLTPLTERSWSVLLAPDETCFVVSDRPVTLYRQKPTDRPVLWSTYWGRRTDVVLPISRHIAVMGRFEPQPKTVRLPRDAVAVVNSRTMESATRFVASSGPFDWMSAAGKLMGKPDLLQMLRASHS